MKSFPFWLATAIALGSAAGTVLRPGIPEIVIAWTVLILAGTAVRSYRRKRRVELST